MKAGDLGRARSVDACLLGTRGERRHARVTVDWRGNGH